MRKITNIIDFLLELDLLQTDENGNIIPAYDRYTSLQTAGSYIRNVYASDFSGNVEERKEYFTTVLQHNPDLFKNVRFGLSYHTENIKVLSLSTFQKTKIICLIDIDEQIPEVVLLETIEQLSFKPSYIKRTYKGWHLIYVANDYFTVEENDILMNIRDAISQAVLKTLKQISKKVENKDPRLAETRIVSEELYVYATDKIYDKTELLSFEKVERKSERYINLSELKKTDIDIAYSICTLLQDIDENWRLHTYNQWFLMSYIYALKELLGDTTAKKEFIEKSSHYPNFSHSETETLYENTKRWITEKANYGEGFLFSCSKIRELAGEDETSPKCQNCPVAKKNHLFMFVKNDFPVFPFPYVEKDGKICLTKIDEDNLSAPTLLPIVYAFRIVAIYTVHFTATQSKDYLKLIDWEGREFVVEYNYNTAGKLDMSKLMKVLIPASSSVKSSHIAEMMTAFINHYRQLYRKIEVFTHFGYKCLYDFKTDTFKNSVIVAGYKNYNKRDLIRIIADIEEDSDITIPVPEVFGSVEQWLNAWRSLHQTKDPLLAILVGFSLMQLNKDYFPTLQFTPIAVIRALKGTGKTIRLLTATTLFTSPFVFSYSTLTKAKILNSFGMYKYPIFFDEVILELKNDKSDDLKELIYIIANKSTKSDAYKTTRPVTSPTVFAGETRNFPIEKIVSGGLTRRILPIDIDKHTYRQQTNSIRDIFINTLRRNYGFIANFIPVFQNTNALSLYFTKYKKLIQSVYPTEHDLLDMIAVVLTNYKLFAEHVLELAFDEEYEKSVLDMLLYGISSIQELDEELQAENLTTYEKLKTIHQKVVRKVSDRVNSIDLSDLVKEAGITFSNTDKDLKFLWQCLVGDVKFYRANHQYQAKYYFKDNLFDAVFVGNKPGEELKFPTTLKKELQRLKLVVEWLKKKDSLDKFRELYFELLQEVKVLYPNYTKDFEFFLDKLEELGLLSYSQKLLLLDYSTSTPNDDEAVEF